MFEIAYRYLGDVVDLVHRGHIAVADADGRLLYSYGEPERITYMRSAAKPLQALAVAASGALEHFGITDRELAVMCASHNGEPFHIETVRSILNKAGLNENFLRCGPEYPMFVPAEDELKRQNIPRAPIFCDCSGKHAGMLLTAAYYGEPLDSYERPEHPVQKRIKTVISAFSGVAEKNIKMGTDGCGVPVHAIPLRNAAQAFARLSAPERIADRSYQSAACRVIHAMTANPAMVGGTGRFCTELMDAFGNRLIGKSGAGAYYAVGLRGRGIGIAVKMEEGASNIIPLAVLESLVQIGVITREEADAMPCYRDKKIYNTRKEANGYFKPVFRLNPIVNLNLF